jgi:hypothetical protein
MAYPNPGSGVYTLQYLSEANEIAYLSVFNMLGELVQQSKAESQAGIHRQSIDLSNQPAGTYIVKLQQGTQRRHHPHCKALEDSFLLPTHTS